MRLSLVRRLVSWLFALVAVVSCSSVVRAQAPNDTARALARTLGKDGLEAMDAGDLPTAYDRLARAYELHKVPTLALWTGRVLARMGKLVAASECLHEASRLDASGGDEALQRQAQQQAATEYEALLRRIPRLRIETNIPRAEQGPLSIDGEALPNAAIGGAIPLDPGDHRILLVRHDGRERAYSEVHLAEGDDESVMLRWSELASARREPRTAGSNGLAAPYRDGHTRYESGLQRTFGWVLLGLGVAGLGTWGVGGALALHQDETLKHHCGNGECPTPYHDDLDLFHVYRTVSTVGFYTGLASLSVGTALVLTAPSSKPKTRAMSWQGWITPTQIGIRGAY